VPPVVGAVAAGAARRSDPAAGTTPDTATPLAPRGDTTPAATLDDIAAAAKPDPALTARPPGPMRETPAPAEDRPEQALAMKVDEPLLTVRPGETVTFRVKVRNTGSIVEGCSLTVRGVPTAWQRIAPETFNLYLDAEADVTVMITPPKAAKTPAGRMALAIVVRSEVDTSVEQRTDATLVIEPLLEVGAELEPKEIDGKRSGRTYVNLENLGNTVRRLSFTGTEPGKRLRFTFRPEQLEVRPGHRASAAVDVEARRRVWSGVERPRQFTINVNSDDGPIKPLDGRFTQLASWPRWVLPVVAAVLAIAIPTTLVLLNRSLNKKDAAAGVKVPNVVGLTADAAKASLGQRTLVPNVVNVFRNDNPGQVVDQDPKSGGKLDKGSPVKLFVASNETVPNITNEPWDVAKQQLAAENLKLVIDFYQPSDDDHENLIVKQTPDAGQPSLDGTVHVGVNRGRQQYTLVDYRGLDEASVATSLGSTGFTVTTEVEDSASLKGTILDQVPPAGQTVKKGDQIRLTVSSGHPPSTDSSGGAPTTVGAADTGTSDGSSGAGAPSGAPSPPPTVLATVNIPTSSGSS
jgi:beta-lactam-binding protein with PASTA domain